jgi:hypothetical protein
MNTTGSARSSRAADRTPLVVVALAIVAVGLAVAAGALLVAQVEVSDDAVGATRTCGSVFDSVADRSGWEVWWARDLDELDETVRSALVRTHRCPDAVNGRLTAAALLGAASGSAAVAAVLLRRGRARETVDAGGSMKRLGRITSMAGIGLTAAGAGAIVLLLADADATLFLYIGRGAVAVIGLILLVPAVALIVLGRALVVLDGNSSARKEEIDA